MNMTIGQASNGTVITVTGEVDVNSGYPLYLAAIEEAANGAARVVLDLAGVTFIDSVGLGMLIRARDELADEHESALSLRNPSSRMTTLLELTGLSGAFTIVSGQTTR